MSKFKIGDRVIVNGEISGIFFNNVKGTIIVTKKRKDNTIIIHDYGVRFDKPNPQYHSCEGLCEQSYGFFVDTSNLRSLIPYRKIIKSILKNN